MQNIKDLEEKKFDDKNTAKENTKISPAGRTAGALNGINAPGLPPPMNRAM